LNIWQRLYRLRAQGSRLRPDLLDSGFWLLDSGF
jgi:hypothetical protein